LIAVERLNFIEGAGCNTVAAILTVLLPVSSRSLTWVLRKPGCLYEISERLAWTYKDWDGRLVEHGYQRIVARALVVVAIAPAVGV
jgi:hypothetical protein